MRTYELVTFAALAMSSACITVSAEMTANVRLERSDGESEVVRYDGSESFDAEPYALMCLLTFPLCGGACWYYAVAPGPFDRADAAETARRFVASIGPCAKIDGEVKVTSGGGGGRGATGSKSRLVLEGDVVPKSALPFLCSSRERVDQEIARDLVRTMEDAKGNVVSADVALKPASVAARIYDIWLVLRSDGAPSESASLFNGLRSGIYLHRPLPRRPTNADLCRVAKVVADDAEVQLDGPIASDLDRGTHGPFFNAMALPLNRAELMQIASAKRVVIDVCGAPLELSPKTALRVAAVLEAVPAADVAPTN